MNNQEANSKIKHIIVDLEIILHSQVNMDNRQNLEDAIDLLRNVGVWNYED